MIRQHAKSMVGNVPIGNPHFATTARVTAQLLVTNVKWVRMSGFLKFGTAGKNLQRREVYTHDILLTISHPTSTICKTFCPIIRAQLF